MRKCFKLVANMIHNSCTQRRNGKITIYERINGVDPSDVISVETPSHTLLSPDLTDLRSCMYFCQCPCPASIGLPPLLLSSSTPSLSRSKASVTQNMIMPKAATKKLVARGMVVLLSPPPSVMPPPPPDALAPPIVSAGGGDGGDEGTVVVVAAVDASAVIEARTMSSTTCRGSPSGCGHSWSRMLAARMRTLMPHV